MSRRRLPTKLRSFQQSRIMTTDRSRRGWRAFGFVVIVHLAWMVMLAHASIDACQICDCNKLQGIVNCNSRGLTELPERIPNNTRVLELEQNRLQQIPFDVFLNLKSLIVLKLSNNFISTSFEMPESVINLFAQGNHFNNIEPMMRNGINLESVDFESNDVEILKSGTFKSCAKLLSLNLHYNNISEIQVTAFAGLRVLYELKLAGLKLKELSPRITDGLHCAVLIMCGSDVKIIQPHTFGKTKRLGLIHFSGCKLEEVAAELFLDPTAEHSRSEIDRLVFSSNAIKRISRRAFYGITSFRQLEMSDNQLVDLPDDVFEAVTEITQFVLSNNYIISRGISDDFFVNTSLVGSLDLSSNRLTTFGVGLLRSQSKLRHLYLQRNQISALTGGIFRGLYSLKELMIFDNPITALEDWIFYETKLSDLYMFQTNLSSIGRRPFATMNDTIKQVSLYDNHIDIIADEVWGDLGAICYVAIDNRLKFAPAINRTDLKIELVGDGFAQPINVSKHVARTLSKSGFRCQSNGHLWQCKPCAQGFYGATWFDERSLKTCIPCPAGGFYQIKTGQVADEATGMNCQTCNNGTYVTPAAHPGTNPADCVVCPTGTNKSRHAGFRACPCLDNYYRKDRFGACHLCPPDGLNCSGEYQHLLPGYWWTWNWSSPHNYQSYEQFVGNLITESASYGQDSQRFAGVLPKVHPCPRSESCLNTGNGINASCDDGYGGWLCSRCTSGFYLWVDRCSKCPSLAVFLLELLAVAALATFVVVLVARDLRRKRRSGRSAVSILLARGKILLGFYQVMGELFHALDEVPWPDLLKSMGSFWRLLEVNVMQLVISPRCYFPDFTYPDIYIQFWAGLSFIAVVLLSACCIYAVHACYSTFKKRQSSETAVPLAHTRQHLYLFVVVMLFVSYPSLSSVILTLWPSSCSKFFLDEKGTMSVSLLRSDMSIDCDKRQHVHFKEAARASSCYIVGFPLVLFLCLWWSNKRHRSRIVSRRASGERNPSPGASGRCDEQPLLHFTAQLDPTNYHSVLPTTQASADGADGPVDPPDKPGSDGRSGRDKVSWQSFLSENYKPRFWYWEIVELVRKITQTLFVILFGPDDPFTMFATIVISVGFLVVHAHVKPMKDAAEHRLQMCSLTIILLNLLAASLLLLPIEQDDSREVRKEVLAVVLVLLNLSIVAFVAASLLWTGLKALWQYRICCRLVTCIVDQCCRHDRQFQEGRSINSDNGHTTPEEVDDHFVARPYAEIIDHR